MKKIAFLAAGLVLGAAVLGCGGKSSGMARSLSEAKEAAADDAGWTGSGYNGYSDYGNKMAAAVTEEAEMDLAEEPVPPSEGGAKVQDRAQKIIYSGSLSFEVRDLDSAKAAVEAWAKKFGGYIVNSSESNTEFFYAVNVPCGNFSAAMGEAGSLGSLEHKSVNSRDVTEQFYDLDGRIASRKILLERLNQYLKTAKDMKDLLEIETKINDVTAELEGIGGQMARLQNKISYSRIDVTGRLPRNYDDKGFVLPNARRGVSNFIATVVGFFAGFIPVALCIVIFGVAIMAFGLLLYWLAFGKVGIVRKIFGKIR